MARTTRDPHDGLRALMEDVKRRLRALERVHPESATYEGPRSDLAAGRGPRVRVGLLSDGTYGIERWSSAGSREVGTFAAGGGGGPGD